jgi:hypothetical protein
MSLDTVVAVSWRNKARAYLRCWNCWRTWNMWEPVAGSHYALTVSAVRYHAAVRCGWKDCETATVVCQCSQSQSVRPPSRHYSQQLLFTLMDHGIRYTTREPLYTTMTITFRCDIDHKCTLCYLHLSLPTLLLRACLYCSLSSVAPLAYWWKGASR